MTGMKEGAGEDPFADDATEVDDDAEAPATDEPPAGNDRAVSIPYTYRRDGVTDGRDRVPLFLQSDTKSAEREALRDLEARFDEDVALTDLREALVLAGLDDVDAVADTLAEWGYGVTFDE